MRDWNLTKKCDCCGRNVVLLRLPGFGSRTDPNWFVRCYSVRWDGNPWYVPGTHVAHPKKKFARRMSGGTPEDPFFELD